MLTLYDLLYHLSRRLGLLINFICLVLLYTSGAINDFFFFSIFLTKITNWMDTWLWPMESNSEMHAAHAEVHAGSMSCVSEIKLLNSSDEILRKSHPQHVKTCRDTDHVVFLQFHALLHTTWGPHFRQYNEKDRECKSSTFTFVLNFLT